MKDARNAIRARRWPQINGSFYQRREYSDQPPINRPAHPLEGATDAASLTFASVAMAKVRVDGGVNPRSYGA